MPDAVHIFGTEVRAADQAILPDLLLLRRYAQSRDSEAFAELSRRHAGAVFATCRRILGDGARAEEVAQETFFKLLTRPEQITESVGAWLHRAATRLSIDARRSEASRRARERRYAQAHAEQAGGAELGEIHSWAELSPVVDEALSELPADAQALLVGHFLEGQPQAQLAAAAGVSAATMSRRMAGAIDLLQRALRRRGIVVAAALLVTLLPHGTARAAPPSLLGGLGKMTMLAARGPRGVGSGAGAAPAASNAAAAMSAVKGVLVVAVLAATILLAGLAVYRLSGLGLPVFSRPAPPPSTPTTAAVAPDQHD